LQSIAALPSRIKVHLSLRPKRFVFDLKCRAAVETYFSAQALDEPAH
jgi:hypothetical protein